LHFQMIKQLKFILLGIIVGGVIVFAIYSRSSKTESTEDADLVIERIEAVKKLVVTEGYFSELYNYKEADKYFYDLIQFEKKAFLLVKGKASVSYDLTKMEYQVDEATKTITLINMPAPQISVEPEIKYYDLQESTFNAFGTDDYNKLNARAVAKLKEKVEKSDLKSMARKELESTLNDLQIVGKELGWKIVVPQT
jgi:hypothetical protein